MSQTFGPDRTDPSNAIFMPRQGRSDQHPDACFHDRMPAVSTPASRRRPQPRAAPARSCYRTRECASADRGGRRESNGMPERGRPRPGASVGVKEAAATFAPLRGTRVLAFGIVAESVTPAGASRNAILKTRSPAHCVGFRTRRPVEAIASTQYVCTMAAKRSPRCGSRLSLALAPGLVGACCERVGVFGGRQARSQTGAHANLTPCANGSSSE
jgi:hypothetical protein